MYVLPVHVPAIYQLLGAGVDAQLAVDPEVILIREEVREAVLLSEERAIELLEEPRTVLMSDGAPEIVSYPRERTR